jgi:catechol 2,3-dioxygenase-like lactoylglutathione lyase family enzyme
MTMQILFIASVAVVAADPPRSRRLYVDALGLPLQSAPDDDYFHSEQIAGARHFAVWPLSQAARACFGTDEWPADRPIPQVSLEFEVADAAAVAAAAQELEDRGFELLHRARTEPWGQTVARLLSPEGSIVGISYAPSLHTE